MCVTGGYVGGGYVGGGYRGPIPSTDSLIRAEKPLETVDHPAHYNQYKGLEVIDLVEQMNFNRGNAVKYVARAGFKSPEKELKDLKKARWYIDREIQRLEGRVSEANRKAFEAEMTNPDNRVSGQFR
jgi:hypothetical protein